jgi:galactose mutarotase-like enzyme
MYHVRETTDIWPAFDLIDDEREVRVRVVPARGGLVTTWEVQGQSLLYLDPETYADPQKNVRGGIPILFPICGRLKDDTYWIGNREYHMPQHGLARRLPWRVLSAGVSVGTGMGTGSGAGAGGPGMSIAADTGVGAGVGADGSRTSIAADVNTGTGTEEGAFLRLGLESDQETRAFFPFDFRLEFEYRLSGNELAILQTYHNYSQEQMPLYPGLHPYFAAASKHRWQFRVPAEHCHDLLTGQSREVSEAPDWQAAEQNFIYSGLSGRFAAMHRDDGTAISIGYSREHRRLVFWTLGNKPFICLEPCVAVGNLLDKGTIGDGGGAGASGAPLWVGPGGHLNLAVHFIFHRDGRKPS